MNLENIHDYALNGLPQAVLAYQVPIRGPGQENVDIAMSVVSSGNMTRAARMQTCCILQMPFQPLRATYLD